MKTHLPESFLRRFAAPGDSLWLHTHGSGWRQCGVEAAAWRDASAPELDDAFRSIEMMTAATIDDVVYRRTAPKAAKREALAYFLALLQSRTPTFYDDLPHPLWGFMHRLTQLYYRYYADNASELDNVKQRMAANGEPLPGWYKPEHLNPLSPGEEPEAGTSVQWTETVAGILNAMTWNFFTTSEEAPFITSDAPFVCSSLKDDQAAGALLHTSTQVTIPLFPTIALTAGWPKIQENVFEAVDEKRVEEVNLRVIASSERYIVASSPDFPGARHLEAIARTG
jgi:hypothetical protein